MPRTTKNPQVFLALSPAAVATALGIRPDEVADAINDGKLIVRRMGIKRRVAVFGTGGVQQWFESWPKVVKPKRKAPSNG
jgi:hypothetical protein